jgi:tRNA pseudouridine(55) synthase
MKKYITTEKKIGETPLQATERARLEHAISPKVPLAYAGRLDPMASGKLLILVGDECKVQEKYHGLDKEYRFEVLLGVGSDTHDVLGITIPSSPTHPDPDTVINVLSSLTGTITLPYPHFSSKTVQGKPLHMWTLEKRLHEIEIPTKTSRIYRLALNGTRTMTTHELMESVQEKIARVGEVTDPRKALGEDFRRKDVLASWEHVGTTHPDETYTILSVTCVASSGTYMRTRAHII